MLRNPDGVNLVQLTPEQDSRGRLVPRRQKHCLCQERRGELRHLRGQKTERRLLAGRHRAQPVDPARGCQPFSRLVPRQRDHRVCLQPGRQRRGVHHARRRLRPAAAHPETSPRTLPPYGLRTASASPSYPFSSERANSLSWTPTGDGSGGSPTTVRKITRPTGRPPEL